MNGTMVPEALLQTRTLADLYRMASVGAVPVAMVATEKTEEQSTVRPGRKS